MGLGGLTISALPERILSLSTTTASGTITHTIGVELKLWCDHIVELVGSIVGDRAYMQYMMILKSLKIFISGELICSSVPFIFKCFHDQQDP